MLGVVKILDPYWRVYASSVGASTSHARNPELWEVWESLYVKRGSSQALYVDLGKAGKHP